MSGYLLRIVCAAMVCALVRAFSGEGRGLRQLLCGVNIGGLGTPIASLASLITIKFYMRWPNGKILRFLGFFTAANIVTLAVLLLFSKIL